MCWLDDSVTYLLTWQPCCKALLWQSLCNCWARGRLLALAVYFLLVKPLFPSLPHWQTSNFPEDLLIFSNWKTQTKEEPNVFTMQIHMLLPVDAMFSMEVFYMFVELFLGCGRGEGQCVLSVSLDLLLAVPNTRSYPRETQPSSAWVSFSACDYWWTMHLMLLWLLLARGNVQHNAVMFGVCWNCWNAGGITSAPLGLYFALWKKKGYVFLAGKS